MPTLLQLSQWWNLIFVVPFFSGVMLVLMSVMGAGRHGTRGGHRVGGHHGGGHRVAVHSTHSHTHAHSHLHHQGRGASYARGHKTSAKTQRHNTENGTEQWSLMRALHLQNIPSQMLLQNFLLFWGVVGWTCNQFAAKSALHPAQFVMTSIFAALMGGFFCTFLLSATMARFMPGDETFAIHKADLEGHAGEAVSAINERSGSVYVRDESGTLHSIAARILADDEPVARGEQVLVVAYCSDGDYFQVKKWSP